MGLDTEGEAMHAVPLPTLALRSFGSEMSAFKSPINVSCRVGGLAYMSCAGRTAGPSLPPPKTGAPWGAACALRSSDFSALATLSWASRVLKSMSSISSFRDCAGLSGRKETPCRPLPAMPLLPPWPGTGVATTFCPFGRLSAAPLDSGCLGFVTLPKPLPPAPANTPLRSLLLLPLLLLPRRAPLFRCISQPPHPCTPLPSRPADETEGKGCSSPLPPSSSGYRSKSGRPRCKAVASTGQQKWGGIESCTRTWNVSVAFVASRKLTARGSG